MRDVVRKMGSASPIRGALVTRGGFARGGALTICGVPKGVSYQLVLEQSESMLQLPPATFPQDGVYLKLSTR